MDVKTCALNKLGEAWGESGLIEASEKRKSVIRMQGKCNLHTYVEYSFIQYVVNG
uniref:Uncharacterized protein n=1 Tax=Helianthus annuus TaxID=4232 RepID=A0A251U9K9_HELAN